MSNEWGITEPNEADGNKVEKLLDVDREVIKGTSFVITEQMIGDDDHTPTPATVQAAGIIKVTSNVSLTATRNFVMPMKMHRWVLLNNTTGGQSIVVKGSTGTGVTITNGSRKEVVFDGINFIDIS